MPDEFPTPESSLPDQRASEPPGDEAREIGEEIGELARRSLLEAATMREIRGRLAELSERMLKLTPPPNPSEDDEPPPGSSGASAD